jgi:hypothetical protein
MATSHIVRMTYGQSDMRVLADVALVPADNAAASGPLIAVGEGRLTNAQD